MPFIFYSFEDSTHQYYRTASMVQIGPLMMNIINIIFLEGRSSCQTDLIWIHRFLREAHFTSSALGDQLGLLSVVWCLSLFFEKIYTEQRQGDHAFTAWCFDRNIQILRVFPVFGPVSSATYASYLRIEGSRKRSNLKILRKDTKHS